MSNMEQNTKKPENKPVKEKKAKLSKKNKYKHGTMALVMSLVFIVLVIGVNVVTSLLAERFPSINIDLTSQKLHSLSEDAVEIAKGVNNETTFYIMTSEDVARGDQIYAQYFQYSQIPNLIDKMRELNQNISMHFVELDSEPDFVNKYPNETLNTGYVIVQTDRRYKVLTIDDLFGYTQDSTTGAYDYFSKVDGALANALTLVNLDEVPIVAVATGHSEALTSSTMSTFLSIFEGMAFTVEEFSILTDEVPADTQVLIIPTPMTDYTTEEITKLREFLSDDSEAKSKTIVYSCFYSQGDFPMLDSFLEEWGVSVGAGVVQETNSSNYYNDPAMLFANSNTDVLEGSYGYLLSPASSPIEFTFGTNNDISTTALWTTSADATLVVDEDSDTGITGEYVVGSLSSRYVQKQSKSVTENVVVLGSSYSIMDNYISASIFGNRNYYEDLFAQITGAESDQIYIEQIQTSSYDVAMSSGTVLILGLGVFTIAIPLVILIAGLVIFLRRRHL